MHIKRLTLKLPARFKTSAHQDAKKIAAAIALQLAEQSHSGEQQVTVTLTDHGESSMSLAQEAAHHVATQSKGNP